MLYIKNNPLNPLYLWQCWNFIFSSQYQGGNGALGTDANITISHTVLLKVTSLDSTTNIEAGGRVHSDQHSSQPWMIIIQAPSFIVTEPNIFNETDCDYPKDQQSE